MEAILPRSPSRKNRYFMTTPIGGYSKQRLTIDHDSCSPNGQAAPRQID